jgi:LPS sulfotransferase NodH
MIFEKRKHNEVKQWQVDLFSKLAKNEPRPTTDVHTTFCVLSTPRSGSTFFCDTLNHTLLLGWTEEWFNYEYFYSWQQATGLDFTLEKYITWVIEHTQRDTGVFGVHWHIAQVFTMLKDYKFGLGNFKFDHVFYLRRRDKIAQAVSMARATKSDQFRHYEVCQDHELPTYSQIARALHIVTDHEEAYDAHLRDDSHHTWWYEEYQNNPGAFDDIVRTLGIPAQDTYPASVEKQRTANSRQLTQDFKDYLRGEV